MVLLPVLVGLLSERPRLGLGWLLSRPSRSRAVALVAVTVVVFLVAADRWYIRFEERVLTESFGQQFEAYRSRTRRWI